MGKCASLATTGTAYGISIDPSAQACMLTQLVLGVLTLALGIVATVFFPVCFLEFSLFTALGMIFICTGAISYATAQDPYKTNFPSRVATAMVLHVVGWVMSAHCTEVGLGILLQGFLFSNASDPSQSRICPYVDPDSDTDQTLIYTIFGCIAAVFVLISIGISVPSFVALWRAKLTKPSNPYWSIEPKGDARVDLVRSPNFSHTASVESVPSLFGDQNVWHTPTTNHAGQPVPSPGQYQFTAHANGYPTYGPSSTGQMAPRSGLYAPPRSLTNAAEPKPLRIVSADRSIRKVVAVTSLVDLCGDAHQKMNLELNERLRIYIDETGEEIEDETIFRYIPDYCRLMICSEQRSERWTPPESKVGQDNLGYASLEETRGEGRPSDITRAEHATASSLFKPQSPGGAMSSSEVDSAQSGQGQSRNVFHIATPTPRNASDVVDQTTPRDPLRSYGESAPSGERVVNKKHPAGVNASELRSVRPTTQQRGTNVDAHAANDSSVRSAYYRPGVAEPGYSVPDVPPPYRPRSQQRQVRDSRDVESLYAKIRKAVLPPGQLSDGVRISHQTSMVSQGSQSSSNVVQSVSTSASPTQTEDDETDTGFPLKRYPGVITLTRDDDDDDDDEDNTSCII